MVLPAALSEVGGGEAVADRPNARAVGDNGCVPEAEAEAEAELCDATEDEKGECPSQLRA